MNRGCYNLSAKWPSRGGFCAGGVARCMFRKCWKMRTRGRKLLSARAKMAAGERAPKTSNPNTSHAGVAFRKGQAVGCNDGSPLHYPSWLPPYLALISLNYPQITSINREPWGVVREPMIQDFDPQSGHVYIQLATWDKGIEFSFPYIYVFFSNYTTSRGATQYSNMCIYIYINTATKQCSHMVLQHYRNEVV